MTSAADPEDTQLVGVLDMFEAARRTNPTPLAVVDDRGNAWTRAELDAAAHLIGERLAKAGATPGHPVLICMPNRIEWVAAYLGVLLIGGIPATLPVTSDPVAMATAMRQVGAQLILLARSHRKRDFADEIDAIATAFKSGMGALLFGDELTHLESITVEGPERAIIDLPESTAHILFSSSTTGAPKAIAHSEASLAAYNIGIISRYSVGADDTILMPSPLGHSTGVWHGVRMSLMTGARLIVQDVWDPVVALRLADEYTATITVAATPFLKDLVEYEREGTGKLRSMRTFLCGGTQVPPELLTRAARELPHTFVGAVWAMSEGGATSSLPGDTTRKITQTCGVPLPGVELATIDEHGAVNPPGREGELVMRTPSQCLGYVGQEEQFRQCFTANGYFRTGDLAVLDDQGYMTITGRLKDLIIRGGVNIGPVPIENALQGHPDIYQVAVVGMPEERMGERICAVVVTHSKRALTLEDITAWLRQGTLPKRMWPEEVVNVSALPMTPAGKVRKRDLVKNLWAKDGK